MSRRTISSCTANRIAGTTEQAHADVEASVDTGADAGVVYTLITDLPAMAVLAAETTSMEWVKGDAAGWATGVKDRKSANAEHIAQTLRRLKEMAEGRGGAAPAAPSN